MNNNLQDRVGKNKGSLVREWPKKCLHANVVLKYVDRAPDIKYSVELTI